MSALATRWPFFAFSLLGVLLAGGIAVLIDLTGLWNELVRDAIAMQRELHKDLASAMRAVERSESAAHWTLISLGFLYGVFHAIGPGHGKVVISTYLATHESRLGRGIALSLASSLVQGLTAILLVGGVALILERSMRESQRLGTWLEVLSYGLIVLIGAFLIWRGARRWFRRDARAAEKTEACCHGHGPTTSDLDTPLTKAHLLAMIVSIGIRPCSGAILVLVLAFAMQQLWAGISAVVAMSIGTGLSISALAILSVYARKGALKLAGALDHQDALLARLIDIAAIIGGLLIMGFGFALLNASLAVSQHPLL